MDANKWIPYIMDAKQWMFRYLIFNYQYLVYSVYIAIMIQFTLQKCQFMDANKMDLPNNGCLYKWMPTNGYAKQWMPVYSK